MLPSSNFMYFSHMSAITYVNPKCEYRTEIAQRWNKGPFYLATRETADWNDHSEYWTSNRMGEEEEKRVHEG